MKKIAHSRSFYGIINWPAGQQRRAGDEGRRPVELDGGADRLWRGAPGRRPGQAPLKEHEKAAQ